MAVSEVAPALLAVGSRVPLINRKDLNDLCVESCKTMARDAIGGELLGFTMQI
jgi:hypothetical protein